MEKESHYKNIGPVAIEWRAMALAAMTKEQRIKQVLLLAKIQKLGQPLSMLRTYLDDENVKQMPGEHQKAMQDLIDFHIGVFASFLHQFSNKASG